MVGFLDRRRRGKVWLAFWTGGGGEKFGFLDRLLDRRRRGTVWLTFWTGGGGVKSGWLFGLEEGVFGTGSSVSYLFIRSCMDKGQDRTTKN